MAVSELEQRYVPLIESQVVWQPWGPAGRYPLDEGHEEVSKAKRTHPGSWQRSHSWGGYTTDAQRERFQVYLKQLFGESNKGPESQEGHTPSPHAPTDMQESITQGSSKLTCGSAIDCEVADPTVYCSSSQHSDSEVGLDALKSQCSSELLGTSNPSENSWENSCDCPDSDDQWPQAFQNRGGTSPHRDAQDFDHSSSHQASSPRNSGHREPGSRKHGRRGHRVGKSISSEIAPTEVTTLMVQNLPYALSRDDLLGELDRCGYGDLFNFCHVPRTFATGKNQGVAFVNFLSPEIAERFAGQWHGNRSLLGMNPSGKGLRVKVATVQGIEACERIAQSRRMRRVKTGTFKPLIVSGQVPQSP